MMFNISLALAALTKRASKAFLGQRHVLVFAPAIRLGLQRLEAGVLITPCARA
jgi:hypothetical protein